MPRRHTTDPVAHPGKNFSIILLLVAEVAAMSLWFTSAAVLPDMLREHPMSPLRQALLSSGVQAGFVVGAVLIAITGLADRLDPRRVLAVSAIMAAGCNALLLILEPGGATAILMRVATGALLAGVYPVGMKIAVGWGKADRGFLIGTLVGALTLGTALPHMISLIGGAAWQVTIAATSLCAALGGALVTRIGLGPYHAQAPAFDPRAIRVAWTDPRIRYAYLGYLGHMWELYVMWAWIGLAVAASYGGTEEALALSKLTAFVAITFGGIASVFAGVWADRIGKARVTILAMGASGAAAFATAATFGGPVWLTFLLVVIWGATVIPDSAQFSAIVADVAKPDLAGSLLTLQTALGFTLTIFTVQLAPWLAGHIGWDGVIFVLALGPLFGIWAMRQCLALSSSTDSP